jgi:hypothetical protein
VTSSVAETDQPRRQPARSAAAYLELIFANADKFPARGKTVVLQRFNVSYLSTKGLISASVSPQP